MARASSLRQRASLLADETAARSRMGSKCSSMLGANTPSHQLSTMTMCNDTRGLGETRRRPERTKNASIFASGLAAKERAQLRKR